MRVRFLIVAVALVALAALFAVAGLTRDLGPLERLPMGTLVGVLLIGAVAVSRQTFRRA